MRNEVIKAGVKAGDYIIDATQGEPKTYKIESVGNIIVNGTMVVMIKLETGEEEDTKTLCSDSFHAMHIVEKEGRRTLTIVAKGEGNRGTDRERSRLLVANRRGKVSSVNTVDLTAFDAEYPHLAPHTE